MRTHFRNRTEAGKLLAKALAGYANRPEVLVLALPRGGVPVAFEVAQALNAPLDVFVVRKLGVPGHEELAMGAIASGGVRVLNRGVVDMMAITDEVVEATARRELGELQRRERTYRGHRLAPEVRGHTIILVDDGIATGSTMRAAVKALRELKAGRIIVAAPTVAASTAAEMQSEGDKLVALTVPEDFAAVGQWYDDFAQTTDEEVCELLEKASHAPTNR